MRWWSRGDWREALPVDVTRSEMVHFHGHLLHLFELWRAEQQKGNDYAETLRKMIGIMVVWRGRLAAAIWQHRHDDEKPTEDGNKMRGYSIRRLSHALGKEAREKDCRWLKLMSEYTGYYILEYR